MVIRFSLLFSLLLLLWAGCTNNSSSKHKSIKSVTDSIAAERSSTEIDPSIIGTWVINKPVHNDTLIIYRGGNCSIRFSNLMIGWLDHKRTAGLYSIKAFENYYDNTIDYLRFHFDTNKDLLELVEWDSHGTSAPKSEVFHRLRNN
jgi:hypothetical protein